MNKRAKRILIICKGHPNIAGAQLYLKHICSAFSSGDCELHFALRRADGVRVFEEIAKECGVQLWEYDWRHLNIRASVAQGFRLINRVKPDLVLFNSSEDEVLAPVWSAWVCRVPKRIMTVHWSQLPNSLPLFRKESRFGLPVPSRYSITKRIPRAISFQLISKFIMVNGVTRQAYIDLYKIRPRRCITIYNGIDTGSFEVQKDERQKKRYELGLASGDWAVLATGNLTPVKGYSYLISAIHELLGKGIRVRCLIAGQGELREELQKMIDDLGLEQHVSLLGYRNDVRSLLGAADIFCMSSINEGLPYSLLEAMATGVPVVASSVGGISEVVTDGREGLLVHAGQPGELSEAIEKLVRDGELRKTMGSRGRQTAQEKFSLERMISETRQVLVGELNG